MKLTPLDTDLIGAWLMKKGAVTADRACRRIDWLIANHLVQLGVDASGWDELYRDPDDGRLWELTWPQSEMHGGGPPRLTCVAVDAARAKYGAIIDT
ncbi:MAG: hypothetical protein EXR87_00495 [Gammaproteobacteria bacterium]|nr:hypothetical protein [Gammaproteobacteria bacterium]